MGLFAAQVIQRAESGRVLCAFCDDVHLARLQLRAAAEELEPLPTVVALDWDFAPSLAHEIEEIRHALAQAASALWPDWYITAEQRFERSRRPDARVPGLIAEATHANAQVSAGWLREAWQRCSQGRLPLVDQLTVAEQVRQLSRALDPKRLLVALSVISAEASLARIRGLARAAEWLAHESQAKTVLLLPGAWHGHDELDHVSYEAVWFQTDERRAEQVASRPPTSQRSQAGIETHGSPGVESIMHVAVGPVVGKPHPGSEVEHLLHERITRDRELSRLFEYNQRLSGIGGQQYIVDLVWRGGGLVVEIDGPEHHGHLTYVKDRDRDYRLYMNGFTTLRVTNDEVCVDVDRVLTKIKNMVTRIQGLQRGSSNAV